MGVMGSGKQTPPPSFNMMFAYFKQQGYTDQVAAAEARRCMFQVTGAPLLGGPVMPPTSSANGGYDRSSLLSGIKIPSKPVLNAWNIPVSTAPVVSHRGPGRNAIPIMLKVSKSDKDPRVRDQTYLDGKAVIHAPIHGQLRSVPPEFSRDMTIDVKGTSPMSHSANPSGAKVPTMDDINAWIQRLYAHHCLGATSRAFRAKISEYVEGIVQKHRNGCLTSNDLVIKSADEIMGKKEEPISNNATLNAAIDVGKPPCETKRSSMPPPDEGEATVSNPHASLMTHDNGNKSHDSSTPLDVQELQRRQQRVGRFKEIPHVSGVYNLSPIKGRAIIGTCETLEKPYLRLTGEPNPTMVRPEHVLKKSFKHVFDTFMKSRNYRYIEEQLRSIRQDIQVQHIRSPFVVKLYATNARLALVHGDLDQFNQCQTQLIQLHHHVPGFSQYRIEFEYYCFLYLSMQNMHMDILRYLRNSLNSDFRRSVYYRYATSIRLALAEGNFVGYFRMADTREIDNDKCMSEIYREAFSTGDFSESVPMGSNEAMECSEIITVPPFYSKFLFRMFEPRFRMSALVNMARYIEFIHNKIISILSTAVSLSIETIKNALNFDSLDECLSFIRENRGTMTQHGLLDCKRSLEEFMSSPLLRNKKL